jgi:hypothetical protein
MKFSTVHSTQAAMPITRFGSCQAVRKMAEMHLLARGRKFKPERLAKN